MKRRKTLELLGISAAVVVLLLAWRAGEWQAQQYVLKIQPPPPVARGEAPPPVEIWFPPEPVTPSAQPADPNSPAARLHRTWETNAQQPPPPPLQPLTEPSWVVSGVVQQGEQSQLMVRYSGQEEVRFFQLGDTLPGGSKLLWVKPTVIGVLTPQRKTIQIPILEGLALPGEHTTPISRPDTRAPERQR